MFFKILSGILAFTLLFTFSPLSVAEAQGPPANVLWPSAMQQSQQQLSLPNGEEGPHVLRTGLVELSVDTFLPIPRGLQVRMATPAALKGRGLSLRFFPDSQFGVVVESESRPKPDVLSLSGRVTNQPVSTFTMTVTQESFLITLQDLETATLYRVIGDTETGLGRLTEIDIRKMPPIEYLPPVIPTDD